MNRPCVTPHQPPSGFERSRRTDSATKLGNPTFIYPTNESLRAGVSPQKKGGSATSDRDTTDACEPGLHGPCAMHGPSAVRRAESAHTAVSKRRHRRMATTARVMVTHGRRCPPNHPHRRSTPLGPLADRVTTAGHDAILAARSSHTAVATAASIECRAPGSSACAQAARSAPLTMPRSGPDGLFARHSTV